MCLFWTQRKIFWRMRVFFLLLWKSMVSQNSLITNFLQQYHPLCSEQTHSYRFGVNDERIFIFGCTVPLRDPKIQCYRVFSSIVVSWCDCVLTLSVLWLSVIRTQCSSKSANRSISERNTNTNRQGFQPRTGRRSSPPACRWTWWRTLQWGGGRWWTMKIISGHAVDVLCVCWFIFMISSYKS